MNIPYFSIQSSIQLFLMLAIINKAAIFILKIILILRISKHSKDLKQKKRSQSENASLRFSFFSSDGAESPNIYAVINNAAINICVYKSLFTCQTIFLADIPRSRISGSKDVDIFEVFVTHCQIIPKKDGFSLHSYRQ